MKNFILFSIIIFTLSSCMTLHSGYLSPLSQNLDESSFRYIKTVYGEASATYFLGFGGGKKEGLIRLAKEDLRKRHQIQDGQTFINFTVDEQFSTMFGIVSQKTIIISADLIDRSKSN